MPSAVIRLQSKLIQMKESRVLKVIGIILISIVIIILGLFKFWKETHNELQDNTNYIFKMIIAMDLGLDEQESDDLISSLSKEDTTDIDDILNKYTKGFKFIDKLSEVQKADVNIDDIINKEDKDKIQSIYMKEKGNYGDKDIYPVDYENALWGKDIYTLRGLEVRAYILNDVFPKISKKIYMLLDLIKEYKDTYKGLEDYDIINQRVFAKWTDKTFEIYNMVMQVLTEVHTYESHEWKPIKLQDRDIIAVALFGAYKNRTDTDLYDNIDNIFFAAVILS